MENQNTCEEPKALEQDEPKTAKKAGKSGYVWSSNTRHDGKLYAKGSVCELKGDVLKKLVTHGVVKVAE